ncbi:MAG: 2-C-methyl-D-erythritol 4-phosphate cytidylyltransferase [Desulforegulaceae bacterium]|nr:2-C-methyl-D-erythritol 4-phosphate cytidylyltransferase [Desulforegulaceae bacterium]
MDIISVVIVAGGSGSRMGAAIPKQFLEIKGLPILFHTLILFDSIIEINEIIIVVPKDLKNSFMEKLENLGLQKKYKVKSGGKTRQESVKNGLSVIDPLSKKVLIHDGVRPFVKEEEIKAVISELDFFDGAVLGIPVVETIKKTDSQNLVSETISRENVFLAQTPQGFKTSILKKVHQWALEDGLVLTDDSALMENFGFGVKIVEGSRENIKITTPADLEFGEKLLSF